ncbi:MAG: efflux RND transporter periplasmic adaptor subunit [Pseudomonadota bacterium]
MDGLIFNNPVATRAAVAGVVSLGFCFWSFAATGETIPADGIRGVVVANAEVTFGSSVAARISKLPFKAGEKFEKGDLLVEFDCGRHHAEMKGAKARLAKDNTLLKHKKKLRARGAAGAFEVTEAKAAADIAQSKVESLSHTIKFCRIKAPFAGRVLERHSDEFEVPGSDDPVISIVDLSQLEVDLIAPSNWLQWLEEGTPFSFKVEETGEVFDAAIARIGAKVDAVSQTIKLTGRIKDNSPRLLPGMSGQARFKTPSDRDS